MRTITTRKSELCWLYHEYTWTKEDYDSWKASLIDIAERNNWTTIEQNYWNARLIALATLIEDLEWDEIATRFETGDDLSLEYQAKDYNGQTTVCRVSLIDELANAMGENAWDADYEIGDACDTDTDYEFNEISVEDE